jgi:hypothetical protein
MTVKILGDLHIWQPAPRTCGNDILAINISRAAVLIYPVGAGFKEIVGSDVGVYCAG